jgi:hypothetical protein
MKFNWGMYDVCCPIGGGLGAFLIEYDILSNNGKVNLPSNTHSCEIVEE